MMRPTSLSWGACCALLALSPARSARADEADARASTEETGPSSVPPPIRFDDRPFDIEFRLGLGSEVGLAGLELEYDAANWVSFGGGVGTNQLGPVFGAHVRLRLAPDQTGSGDAVQSLAVEIGASRGPYDRGFEQFGFLACEGGDTQAYDVCYNPKVRPENAFWSQAEFGYERKTRAGFSFRISAGFAEMLNDPTWVCTQDGAPVPCGTRTPSRFLPVVTLSFAQAF